MGEVRHLVTDETGKLYYITGLTYSFGTSGTDGSTGPSGTSGTSGTDGSTGPSGTSGIDATPSSPEFLSVKNQVSLLISPPVVQTLTGAVMIPVVRRVLTATATPTANNTLQNVTGLSVSVDSGGVYKFEIFMGVNRATAAAIYGYGFTMPTINVLRGNLVAGLSTTNIGAGTLSTRSRWVTFNGQSAVGSILLSTISMATLSTLVEVNGIIIPSANGVIHPQIKSPATSGAQVLAGSYIEVYRIG